MTPPEDVGRVLLVRVHKAPPARSRPLAPSAGDAWFCRWLQLTPHGAAPLCFPCYQWLEGERSLVLREGTGDGSISEIIRIHSFPGPDVRKTHLLLLCLISSHLSSISLPINKPSYLLIQLSKYFLLLTTDIVSHQSFYVLGLKNSD